MIKSSTGTVGTLLQLSSLGLDDGAGDTEKWWDLGAFCWRGQLLLSMA